MKFRVSSAAFFLSGFFVAGYFFDIVDMFEKGCLGGGVVE